MSETARERIERNAGGAAAIGLSISMFIPPEGDTSARFVMQAPEEDALPADPRPYLEKALAALRAELDEIEECPVHAALSLARGEARHDRGEGK